MGCPPNEVIPLPVDGLESIWPLPCLFVLEDWRDNGSGDAESIGDTVRKSGVRRRALMRSDRDCEGLCGAVLILNLALGLSKLPFPSPGPLGVYIARSKSSGGRMCKPNESAGVTLLVVTDSTGSITRDDDAEGSEAAATGSET
jgi:hypothetical protein